MRWHRELIAEKWDHSQKRKSPGRPSVAKEIEELVLSFAKENPAWGYDRIQGALANLGHEISDATVGSFFLKTNGVEPAPVRKKTTTWTTFIKAGGHRLHDRRGLDQARAGDVLPAVRDGAQDAHGPFRRLYAQSQRAA